MPPPVLVLPMLSGGASAPKHCTDVGEGSGTEVGGTARGKPAPPSVLLQNGAILDMGTWWRQHREQGFVDIGLHPGKGMTVSLLKGALHH